MLYQAVDSMLNYIIAFALFIFLDLDIFQEMDNGVCFLGSPMIRIDCLTRDFYQADLD